MAEGDMPKQEHVCSTVRVDKLSSRLRVVKKKGKRFGLPDITLQALDVTTCLECGSVKTEWTDVPVVDGE